MLPILIDTNLLVLLVVGLTDPNYIDEHRRTRGTYDIVDFEAVHDLVSVADEILLCPNVLTEASNLLRQIREPMQSEIYTCFTKLVMNTREEVIPSRNAVAHANAALGLTDAVLLSLAETGGVLLTVDLDLYLAACAAGFEVVNYNHERARRYGL